MSISSDSIQRGLTSSTQDSKKASDSLSSGKKKLDPASVEIVSQLDNEAALYSKSQDNIDYGESISNIQDATYDQAGSILTRISELATQSANGTLSDDQRSSISQETGQLQDELTRETSSADFNGVNVLSGSTSIQAGTDGSSDSQIDISSGDLSSAVSGAVGASVATQSAAAAAIDQLSNAASALSNQQSQVGANQSRLESAKSSSSSAELATATASSKIQDADTADETAKKVSADIRSQVSVALLAQANQSAASVSTLLG